MSNLPAYLQHDDLPDVNALFRNAVGSPLPPRISIAGNRFTLIDPMGNRTPWQQFELPVVIVAGNPHMSKVYRENDAYTPDSADPPDCFSDNGVGPSNQSSKPQSASCVTCRHNERGSAVSKMTGAATKACRDQLHLAVYVVGDMTNTLYRFTVTPGSLGHFRKWSDVLRKANIQMYKVHTVLSFVPGETGVITFGPKAQEPYVSEQLFHRVVQALRARDYDDVVGAKDVPFSGGVPRIEARPAQAPPAYLGVQAPEGLPRGGGTPLGIQPLEPPPTPRYESGPSNSFAPTPRYESGPSNSFAVQSGVPIAAPAAEPAKRVRKPKETVVGPGPVTGDVFTPAQVENTLHHQPPFDQPAAAAHPAMAGQQFGVVPEAPAPSTQLGSALDAIFGARLPT